MISNILKHDRIILLIALATSLVVSSYIGLTLRFDLNDFMYSVVPHLEGNLYDNINYVQAPLSYFALKTILYFALEDNSYITFRIVSIVFAWLSIVVATFLIKQKSLKSLFVVLVTFSWYYGYTISEIGSYTLPFLFLIIALLLIEKIDTVTKYFIAGMMVGFATSSKLSYLLFFLLLPPIILEDAIKSGSQPLKIFIFRSVCLVAVGGFIGLSPILIYFANNPVSFWLHNFIFHSSLTYTAWNFNFIRSIASITEGVYYWLKNIDGAVYVILISMLVTTIASLKRVNGISFKAMYWLIILIISFLGAISPKVLYGEYLYAPSFLAMLGLVILIDNSREIQIRSGAIAIIILAILIGVANFSRTIYVNSKNTISAFDVSRVNQDLSKVTKQYSSCDSSVYSMSGAFVIDTELKPTSPMACGPFWPSVRSVIDRSNRWQQRIDENILFPKEFIKDHNVSFVLLGYFPDMEIDILRYVEANNYKKIWDGSFNGKELSLFVSPHCMAAPISLREN